MEAYIVLQQTPRAVTLYPPSEVIFPPDEAELLVILDIEVVERLGNVTITDVVKLS